jgi:hypothetical protein
MRRLLYFSLIIAAYVAVAAAGDTTFVVPLDALAGITPRTVARADEQILVGVAQAIPAEGPNGTRYWDREVTVNKAAEVRVYPSIPCSCQRYAAPALLEQSCLFQGVLRCSVTPSFQLLLTASEWPTRDQLVRSPF